MVQSVSLLAAELTLAYTLSMLINDNCYRHIVAPWCCEVFKLCNPLNDRSAEHDVTLESYAKIDSN